MLKQIIASIALAVALSGGAASAKMTTDEMRESLTQAKVFDADTKITVAINGTELTIATYKAQRATERDCKIDAVLAAKAALAADSSLSRVTVLFYDSRIVDDYYEVPVTLGDVAAYGSGQISQDQLLSELKLTKHTPPPSTPIATSSTTSAAGTASATASTEAAEKHTEPGAEQKIASATAHPAFTAPPNSINYSNYGASFYYPKSWRQENPNVGNTLVRFYLPGKSMSAALVEMRVYDKKTASLEKVVAIDPEDMFSYAWRASWKQGIMGAVPGLQQFMDIGSPAQEKADDLVYRQWKERYFEQTGRVYHRANYSTVKVPQTINCGANKSVHCLQRAYYAVPTADIKEHRLFAAGAQMAVSEYMHYVVFDCAPYIIQLDLLCPYNDAYSYTTQFDQLLDTVRVTPMHDAHSAHPTPSAAHHKPQ